MYVFSVIGITQGKLHFSHNYHYKTLCQQSSNNERKKINRVNNKTIGCTIITHIGDQQRELNPQVAGQDGLWIPPAAKYGKPVAISLIAHMKLILHTLWKKQLGRNQNMCQYSPQ